MTNYDIFSIFYDQVMGDRSKPSLDIVSYIWEYAPHAKNVLELACGTGSVLKFLAEKYEVHGLDLSEGMLEIASQKVPRAILYHQSMVDFSIDKKFDVILCVFDSINHLLNFNDWKKVFINAKNHLNSRGVFIFDINTQDKLTRTIQESPWIKPFDNNVMIMDVTDKEGISNWNIKVFEKKEGSAYELHEENISEISFPIDFIETELKQIFTEVILKDKVRKDSESTPDSIYFICK